MKDHRFNRVFDCCIRILYHLDDIKLYLDTYKNILNGIAILDRTFLDMELLKPIFCAAALISIHYTTPFLSLLLDTETTYDTLLTAFPIMYNDLKTPTLELLLQTDKRVANFVDDERFKSVLPKDCLRLSVEQCASQYKKEILRLLGIILPRFADGFSEQRGAIFGFGPKADDQTGTLLKVSCIDDIKRKKLEKAPTHNLNEERSVGFINYELQIRGKANLESASKKMVLNKSMDYLENAEPNEIRKFRKPAQEIKKLKLEWKEKLKEHAKELYSEKEKSCLKDESDKFDILEVLKKEECKGPFTTCEEIDRYLALDIDDTQRNKRLYNEVKYARLTSMSLKPSAPVFRLKRDHKNLSTDDYAANLKSYLNAARCCTTITIDDLNNVMCGIIGRSEGNNNDANSETQTSDEIPHTAAVLNESQYQLGEHVIAFWVEGNETKWYLGTVEKVVDDVSDVSYMVCTDTRGKSWTYPESAEILTTSPEQILATKVKVQYFGSVRIRCVIVAEELIEEMNSNV